MRLTNRVLAVAFMYGALFVGEMNGIEHKNENERCAMPSTTSTTKFSVCTMVHDEAKYIEEWIAYHLLLNIDHFYVYDDRSTDNLAEVLAPYIERGVVSVAGWAGNVTVPPALVAVTPTYTRNQRFALADCIYNHNPLPGSNQDDQWFGIWDIDEFLFLDAAYPDIHAFITEFLDVQQLDEFHIPMTIFGSSGHVRSPAGLVIENYSWRSNITMFGTHPTTNKFTGKSLYRAKCASPEVHWSPKPPFDDCRLHYDWPKFEGEAHYPISLHHYFSKSWEDFETKMKKWNWSANKEEFEKEAQFFSEYQDTKLWRFVEPIKQLQDCVRK